MRAAFVVAVAVLACGLVNAVQVQEFKYPKTVVVTAVYNSSTLQSDEITVAEISAAPWSKRSWNKTPRPAALTAFQVVLAYKPAASVAACTIVAPNNTAFTCAFNGSIVAVPLPLTVQYVATTDDNNTAIGYAIIKPVFVKPGREFGPKPHNFTKPDFPWEKDFNKTFPWEKDFNRTFPWEKDFNKTLIWERRHNKTLIWERHHNKTGLGH